MAQKFNIVYNAAKETAYAQASASLVLAASLNSMIQFVPVLQHNGSVDSGATTAEYNIQRVKRIKGADVANSTANTTSAALAALDTFTTVSWETIGVATGVLRSVGVKLGINEEFNPDSLGAVHAKAVSDSVQLQVVERHEALLEEIQGAATGTDKLVYTAGKTDVYDAITAEVNRIMLTSDDYKHMSDKNKMLIVLHPSVADMVAKEIGTVFNQEAPIAQTGMRSGMSINGVPVIVDANLNKFEGAAATEVIGALVLDSEAIAFKAAEFEKPVDVNLGLTRFYGKFFYNIVKAVDTARIGKFELTLGTAVKTKKASAA